jgi:putative DNA primase/helicase
VCILAITHLNKGIGGKALHRVMGSIAFTAAARVAFAVGKDENDPDGKRHLFLPLKNNLGDDRTGLSFTTAVVQLPDGIEIVQIIWGEQTNVSADEALSPPDEGRGARDEAKAFLMGLLADGQVPAEQVKAAAKVMGISEKTLDRAKKELGIDPKKAGMKGPWMWGLPVKMVKLSEDVQIRKVTTFAEDDHLQEGSAEDGSDPATPVWEEL